MKKPMKPLPKIPDEDPYRGNYDNQLIRLGRTALNLAQTFMSKKDWAILSSSCFALWSRYANAGNPFVLLGRDVHSEVMSHLPVKDCVRLASSCFTLWDKSQGTLFKRVMQDASKHRGVDGLNFLADLIDFQPSLRQEGLNYRHLANVLTHAGSMLTNMVKTDPNSAWKIARVSGQKRVAERLLGRKKVATTTDLYGLGSKELDALGGHLDNLLLHLAEFHQPFDCEKVDPRYKLPKMASIGGHVGALKTLRDKLGYKLTKVFPKSTKEGYDETLLTYALMGGDIPTVDFLLAEGVNPYVGLHPAMSAADSGHWVLYDRFAKENNPIRCQEDAIEVAQCAVKSGSLERVLSLIEQHRIPPKILAENVINGGNPVIFWHFIKMKWLLLTDTFTDGAHVQHLLARQGHLALLKDVLKNENATKATSTHNKKKLTAHAVYVLDEHGGTLLHYAAIGGQRAIYRFLLPFFDVSIVLIRDHYGSTVAHSSSEAGTIWFLKDLFQSENGPELIRQVDDFGATILHDAAVPGDPNFLLMIIKEFHIDVTSADNNKNTVVHHLANLALEKPFYWNAIAILLEAFPDANLLDIPGEEDMTVREIISDNQAEAYFRPELLKAPTLSNSN